MMRLPILVVLVACGGGSSGNDCSETQVEVKYFRGTMDGKTECKPIPAACGATASCVVQACISAMYDYCVAPEYIGVGCSDTFPPTIISCNP